jgi:hypothetical protein
MTDHSTLRLGKRPRRHDARTLKLARYVMSALPPAPAAVDYTRGITDWGMMLNDQLGCCTIAAVGHAVQVWTANAGATEASVPDPVILNYYKTWDGYNPANPSSDQGGVELDVLNDWRQQGFAGQSLDAYVGIDLGTRDKGQGTRETPSPQPMSVLPMLDVMDAIWLFGGAYIGVELPVRAQTQEIWDVPANLTSDDEPGSWGGHAIYVVGYDSGSTGSAIADCRLTSESNSRLGIEASASGKQDSEFRIPDSGSGAPNSESPAPCPLPPIPCPGTLTCITWGQLKKMTWAWFEKYCSEAYALVSKDWIKASGLSPSGFDLATLEADLKAVSGP